MGWRCDLTPSPAVGFVPYRAKNPTLVPQNTRVRKWGRCVVGRCRSLTEEKRRGRLRPEGLRRGLKAGGQTDRAVSLMTGRQTKMRVGSIDLFILENATRCGRFALMKRWLWTSRWAEARARVVLSSSRSRCCRFELMPVKTM